jgi:chromosome segregation ATPase
MRREELERRKEELERRKEELERRREEFLMRKEELEMRNGEGGIISFICAWRRKMTASVPRIPLL